MSEMRFVRPTMAPAAVVDMIDDAEPNGRRVARLEQMKEEGGEKPVLATVKSSEPKQDTGLMQRSFPVTMAFSFNSTIAFISPLFGIPMGMGRTGKPGYDQQWGNR